jgi:hypothetical protein
VLGGWRDGIARIGLAWIGFAVAAVAALALAPAAEATSCEHLQEEVNAATAGAVLQLPAGTCETNVTTSNTQPFTLEGTAPGTTLKAKTTTQAIFQINAGSTPATFTLTNLTFTGTTFGNAVNINDSNPAVTISDDAFVTNHSGTGGALSIGDGTAGSTTQPTRIVGDTFGRAGEGNSAIAGGAVFIDTSTPLEIDSNSFAANSVPANEPGGALLILDQLGGSAPVTLFGNVFGGVSEEEANKAGSAGGGAFIQLSHEQTLTLENNAFIGNEIAGVKTAAQPRVGAGLAVELRALSEPGFSVIQKENVFANNVITETDLEGSEKEQPAGGAGEWVFGNTVHSTGDRYLANGVFVNDGLPKYVPEGGGLGVLGEKAEGVVPAQPGTFIGADDFFSENFVAAGGWGGAIYSGFTAPYCHESCPGSSVTLRDSTVLNNGVEPGAGSAGGAFWGSGTDTLAVENSIVYGNTPPQVVGFGGGTTFAFSDICNEPGGTVIAGAGLMCANPKLNGEGEETAASPTVDAGSNALVPAGLATDLVGGARITAGRCGDAPTVDMGAFELPAAKGCPVAATTTTSTTRTSTTNSASGPGKAGLGSVSSTASGAEATVTCSGVAGQACEGEAVLSTTENKRGKKIASLSSKHGKRAKRQQVLIASARFKLSAGQKVKLKLVLNSRGKALLRRFHRVPARLVLTLRANGKSTVVSTRRLTITQRKRGRKSHHDK